MARGQTPPHQVRVITRVVLTQKTNVGIQASADLDLWPSIWETFVHCCLLHRVKYKPDRQFSRNKQEYRRKNRGLDKRRPVRKCKYKEASPLAIPETRKDLKGLVFLLS